MLQRTLYAPFASPERRGIVSTWPFVRGAPPSTDAPFEFATAALPDGDPDAVVELDVDRRRCAAEDGTVGGDVS